MSRARLVVAAALVATVTAASLLVGASAGTGATLRDVAGFRYTHRFTVTTQLVDHWTYNDKSACGRVGTGTFTVRFRTTKACRVSPILDLTAGSEVRGGIGRWVLAIGREGAGGIQDTRPRPGSATATSIDNSKPGPNDPASSEPCPAFDKTDCGTSQDKHAKVSIGGYDRRRLVVDLAFIVPDTGSHGVRCYLGGLEGSGFSDPRLGGSRAGEFLLTMPSPQTLARQRVVRVIGTSHKRVSTNDEGISTTDDVTRTVTVAFTRI